MKQVKRIWAPALFGLWTAFILSRSLQPAVVSAEESGRLLVLLQQILPLELTNHVVRKAAHLIEYAMLGFLGWFVFARRRSWERPAFAAVLCLLVALCDETVQLFVEGRAGMVADIWLDLAGALGGVLTAMILRWMARKCRKA